MSHKNICFIINPRSGIHQKAGIPQLIEKEFPADRFTCAIEFTQYPGHAIQLAKEAVENGFQIIVAVGGDGSINEVGNAIIESEAVLGIIPMGSGNGLARTLNIPINPRKALQVIRDGKVDTIDAGICNGRYFFSVVGCGFDAAVIEQFIKHRIRGLFSYMVAGIKQFFGDFSSTRLSILNSSFKCNFSE